MKILFISSWYPTPANPNFGIFVKEHAKAIQTSGNEIVVLAIVIHRSEDVFSKKVSDFIDENGIRTILIELSTRFKDILYHAIPLQYFIIKSIYNKDLKSTFKPDIVHSNVIFPAGIIGNQLADFLKKPHVITEHWSRIKGFLKKPILSGLGINAYQNAAKILPVSCFLKEKMIAVLPTIYQNNYQVIPNVIDSKTFFCKEKMPNPDLIRFCAIATWANKKIPDKKPELFIEALSRLQTELKQTIVLTMIGGGDKVNELKELCEQESLQTEFTGYLDKKEIAQYLQASDFFVHASIIETFGVVVAEALLCGTPVICSNVGALPELISESNGVLCDNTVESWVEGIKLALKSKFNNNLISIDTGHRFSLESIGNQINDVYKKL
jgi:glycosyltransferase involved in cell wall biosynthesis